jgi:hypothetical protein
MAVMTGASAAAPPTVDPMHAPACLQAMAALEAAASAARPAGAGEHPAAAEASAKARIQDLQKFAAGTCLGAWMDTPPPASRAQVPPVHVSPVPGLAMRAAPVAGTAASPARPAPPQPSPAIVSCTAGGCITSDGAWVARGTGVLLGPEGVYTVKKPGP